MCLEHSERRFFNLVYVGVHAREICAADFLLRNDECEMQTSCRILLLETNIGSFYTILRNSVTDHNISLKGHPDCFFCDLGCIQKFVPVR
jgi:hypothetical protein